MLAVPAGAYALTYSDCASPGSYRSQTDPVTVATGQPVLLAPVALTPASPAQALGTEQAYARSHPALASMTRKPALTGTVRSAAGKPLAGICVTALGHGKVGAGTESLRIEWVAVTSRSGHYSIALPVTGKDFSWRVQFSVGCGSPGNYAPQWWKYAASGSHATKLHQATTSSTISGVNAKLARGAAVTGVVRGASASGPGLSGVCVTAGGRGGQSGVSIRAISGAGGRYDLRGLGSGLYVITFDPYCGQPGNYLSGPGRRVTARAGSTKTAVDDVLPAGAAISGTVTGSQSGNPVVAGICVTVSPASGGIYTAVTSKTGSYTVSRLRAGRYYVAFAGGCGNTGSYAPQYFSGVSSPAQASLVHVAAGATGTADAVMQPGGTVSGAVTGPTGKPAADICAQTVPQQELGLNGIDSSPPALAGGFGGTELGQTNSAGRYSDPDLAPGLYLVLFTPCAGSSTAAPTWFTAGSSTPQWLAVSAGTAATANAALPRGGTISGTVRAASGHPLGSVCVFAVGSSDLALGQLADLYYGAGFGGRSGPSGRYSVRDVTPGRYAVEFFACGFRHSALQFYKDKGPGPAPTLVAVRSGRTTTGINAALSTGRSISVVIRSGPTGRAVNRACVIAGTGASEPILLSGQFGETGPSGRVTLRHLAAGTYDLEAGPCYGSSLAVIQVRLRVPAGRSAIPAITVRLPRPGKLSGTVTGPASAGSAGYACVTATPVSGAGIERGTLASRTGSYLLPGLAPGRYLVQFSTVCLGDTTQLAPAQVTDVTVSAGDTAHASAALTVVGSITGTVTASGAPVAGECVGAFTSATATAPAEVAVTGTEGSYQLGFLATGSYLVRFASGCGATAYSTQWWNNSTAGAASPGRAAPVTVTSGAPSTGINAALAPAA
jgi:hypothetical protein